MTQASPDILAHIRQKLPAFQLDGSAKPLVGGYLNLTWRIAARPHNIIGKWIPPYMASQPEFFLPPERAAFEARALTWLEGHHWEGLRMPVLLDFDEEENVILMEDMGEGQDLSSWMLESDETMDAYVHCGKKLGEFIGKLHNVSWGEEDVRLGFNNHKIQEVRKKVEYQLDFTSLDSPTQKLVKHQEMLAEAVMRPGVCLTMGDFWPQSVLLCENCIPAVIDWEMVHFGHPFQDFAHMWAHLWMHMQVSGGKRKQHIHAMLSTYTETYQKELGMYSLEVFGKEEGRLIPMHVGSEILQRSMGYFVGAYVYEEVGDEVLGEAIEFGRKCLGSGDLGLILGT